MNTNKHLDEQIKKALEHLEATYDPNAWAAFEQRLDSPVANGDVSLEEVIADKLGNLQVPLAFGDWTMMEKMIEADEATETIENEAAIDNLMYEKIGQMEMPFQPHHWQLMARRLEEEFILRYQIFRYKAAEVSLMFLLLLAIVRHMPLTDRSLKANDLNSFPTQPANLGEPAASPAGKTKSGKPTTAPAKAKTTQPTTPIAAAQAPVKPEPKSKKTTKNKAASAASSAGSLAFEENTAAHAGGNMAQIPAPPLDQVNSMMGQATLFESITERKFLQNNLATPGMDANFGNAELLASLNPQPVKSKFAWEMPQLPQLIFEKERELRFSIFTSTDISYVLTPPNKYSVFDTLVATDQDTTLASGYGGGILVNWKKDKWEIQTGGIYSFKRYIPNTPVFLFETVNYYIREEFNGVQLDQLQVPLNVNYHFKNQGKWRFYGIAGASGHFITASVYEIETKRTPSFNNFAILPPPAGLPADDKSIRQEKEFPDGLFDGGSIHDNFYLTANVGLGMERFVSPRWSVFFQPNYQHTLLTDGIGVNNDKFYTFSFYLGTKVSLK